MKRSAPRPLADLLDACLKPALAAQGFAAADIVMSWSEIVGPRLAAYCEPVKLIWPRQAAFAPRERAEPACLLVRVEGVFALELQHMAPIVIERVNAFYGWRCVGRLALRQAPIARARRAERRDNSPDPTALAAARNRVGAVGDEELREALIRLGAAILAGRQAS